MRARISILSLLFAWGTTGCLYVDTINTPPQAEIEVGQERDYFRGEEVEFSAGKSFDPDGDRLFYVFAAEVCGGGGAVCAPLTDLAADLSRLRVLVPTTVGDRPDVAVDVVRAQVTVADDHGAISIAEASWPVSNAPPVVQLQAQSEYQRADNQFPVSLPIRIVAQVEDADDDPGATVLEWRLSERPLASQTGAYSFEELSGPGVLDPAYELIPDVPGVWEVSVTATDAAGTTVEVSITLTVAGDAAPCIVGTNRATTFTHLLDADGVPVSFSVLEVVDEFDPFPATSGGATEFRWSMAGPLGPGFDSVGGNAPSFTIDPAQYSPGDAIDLRVEALDRVPEHEPVCAASEPTCSVDSDQCLQRLTWRIEIR